MHLIRSAVVCVGLFHGLAASDISRDTERRILTAKQAQVRCGVSSGCPEGIGLWTFLEPKGVPSQCTSFLVGPDQVLTNHHCIPPGAARPGGNCLGLVWIHFPSTGKAPADSVSCQEIVALSPTSNRIDQPDWALARLTRPVKREILPVSRQGLRDLDSVSAWTFNPDWGQLALRERIRTELRPIDCRVSRRTKAFHDFGSTAEYSDSLSRKVPLASCPAQKGNSGAPLLRRGEDGIWRVHALLDRSAPTNGVRDWVRSQNLELLDSTLGEFAYATNLACVPLPGSDRIPEICLADSSRAGVKAQEDAWRSEVEHAISARVESVGSSTRLQGRVLQKGAWPHFPKAVATAESRSQALVVPLPTCSSPGAADSMFHVPVWSMRFGYDRDLRWSFRMDLDRPQLAVLRRCKPLLGSRNTRAVCRFDGRFPGIGALPLGSDTLARCTEPVSTVPPPRLSESAMLKGD